MIDDTISSTLGVRTLAEAQAEDTIQPDTDNRSTGGFGSNRKQSQTDEDRQEGSTVHEESELASNKETKGSTQTQDGIEVTKGEVRLEDHPYCGTENCCGECETAVTVTGDTNLVLPAESDENLKDIELAKQNVQNIIEMGDDAVQEMVSIAKQSESPRAFEVVSTLMKTLLDANKEFVDLSSKKKFAEEEKVHGPKETNITNNNLIVSTADLLKMIKDGG